VPMSAAPPTTAPSTRACRPWRRAEIGEGRTLRCMSHPSRRVQARADHVPAGVGHSTPSPRGRHHAGPRSARGGSFTAEQDAIRQNGHAARVSPDHGQIVENWTQVHLMGLPRSNPERSDARCERCDGDGQPSGATATATATVSRAVRAASVSRAGRR
jgi:hypothetical protein